MISKRDRIALVFFVTFIFLFGGCKKPYMPKNERIYVQGEIVRIWYRNQGLVRVTYETKNQEKHEGSWAKKIDKLVLGEKYYIAYNINNPEEINLFYTAPIIEDSIKYKEHTATINSIERIDRYNYDYCSFVYTIEGREYVRYQCVVDRTLEIGSLVSILYCKEKPWIAYVMGNSAITI